MKKQEEQYKNIEGFENKLILNTSIVVAIALFIFSIINIIAGFEANLTYITVSGAVVFSLLFIFGYYYKKFQLLRWIILFICTLYINLTWFFDYVSNGPALILFVLYYCFLILIGNKLQVVVFSIVVTINLLILFLVEYNFYESFPNYVNTEARIVDVYIVTFIALAIAFNFIYYAKRNYLKQYLKAKKADELKSSFLANMSHEIRTPLNAIVGFSSLLASRDNNQEKKEKYKSFIKSNSEYLLHLVNDILDISKIESGQLKLVVEEFGVADLFEQLKEEYSSVLIEMGKNNVQLRYTLHDKDVKLKTDKFRFEQIIRNFLSNAIKFTEQGHVKFGSVLEKEKYVFYVEDTGIGIPEEDLKQLFSRFTKLSNNSPDSVHRGVGLGLFLSKQLAALLGGEIWVKSEQGKGSTFYLGIKRDP